MAKDALITAAIDLVEFDAQLDVLLRRRAELEDAVTKLDAAIAEITANRATKLQSLKDEAKK